MKSSTRQGPGTRPQTGSTTDLVTGDSFPAAFAEALYRRNESLEGLRQRLRDRGHSISLATLSYWRSGQRRPEHAASLEAVAEIECLLGLRDGELRSRLGPSSRLPPSDQPTSLVEAASPILADAAPGDLREREESLQALLDGLIGAQPAQLAEQSVQVTAHVRADRTIDRLDVLTVWRALGDGAECVPLVWWSDDADTKLPVVTVLGGGRLDADLSRPEEGVLARALRLERPLRTREEAVTHYVMDLPALPDAYFEYVLLRRVQEIMLWVKFDEPSPASACLYWGAASGDGSLDVDLAGRTAVHHRRRNFGPGHVGVRWG